MSGFRPKLRSAACEVPMRRTFSSAVNWSDRKILLPIGFFVAVEPCCVTGEEGRPKS